MEKLFQDIVAAIEEFAAAASDVRSVQEFSVKLIAKRLPYYNWVGFYMVDSQDPNVLVLGPFHGAPTEHVRIPVSEGICGAAVAQGETIVIDDVNCRPSLLGLLDRDPLRDRCSDPCQRPDRRGDRHR